MHWAGFYFLSQLIFVPKASSLDLWLRFMSSLTAFSWLWITCDSGIFFFLLRFEGEKTSFYYTHFQKGWDRFPREITHKDSSFIGLSICKMWKYIQQRFIKFLPPYSKGYQVPGCREVKRQIRSLLTESLYLSRRTRFQTYI